MIGFSTNERAREIPEPVNSIPIMKAETLVACHIDGIPKKKGEIVDVCANTLRNLIRDGVLKAVETKSEPE